MLSPEDQQNLNQLVAECKQIGFPTRPLFYSLLKNEPSFISMVQIVCLKDDGTIDPKEAKLITWSRDFIFRFDQEDIDQAYELLVKV